MRQHTKTLGQVFLHDQNIIKKIIRYANPSPAQRIIEIGCGKGILSSALAALGNDLHIIEIDERWLSTVKALNLANTTHHLCDVLTFDFSQFNGKSTIIANIPYNITTPILDHIIQYKNHIQELTIMIQKEVAERILSQPNSKTYGLLTIFCNFHFTITKGFNVSRSCFKPAPNVDSYVLKLIPKKAPLSTTDSHLFFAMARSLFWGRRKTILNCLSQSPYITCTPNIKSNNEISKLLATRGETHSLTGLLSLFNNIKYDISIKKSD